MHVALSNRSINQFKPVQQNRQQALRAYCPNMYTVEKGKGNSAQRREGIRAIKTVTNHVLLVLEQTSSLCSVLFSVCYTMDQEKVFVQKLILQKIKRSDKDKKNLSQQETVSVLQYVASTQHARHSLCPSALDF